MKKFKFYQFALALVAAVLISAAASEINTAYAAPAASAQNFQGALPEHATQVQRHRRHYRHHHRRSNRWVGPAVALGIFGAAAAAAAAQNHYYDAPRQRCWVQSGPYQGQGYWAWC